MAAAIKGDGSFDLAPDSAIKKRVVVFRRVEEIAERNDIDAIVLARREGASAPWN